MSKIAIKSLENGAKKLPEPSRVRSRRRLKSSLGSVSHEIEETTEHAEEILDLGISWAELALHFEMVTYTMLRKGGAGGTPNLLCNRARHLACATKALGRLLGTSPLPTCAKWGQRVYSLVPLGVGRQFGIWPRPTLLREGHLLYELFAERAANLRHIGPQVTWGK